MTEQAARSQGRKRLSRRERGERIVDAALGVFSRRGYRGATTRELARAAGVTEVTLFRHFPAKEKLFAAVLDKYSILPILRDEVAEGPGRRGDFRETLRHIGRQFLGILKERRHMIRLILSEAVTNPEQARMLFRQGPGRFLKDTAKLLRQFQEKGEVRDLNLTVASRAVLGAFFTFILFREVLGVRDRGDVDFDQAADELSDLLWRGLRAEAPPGKTAARAPARKAAARKAPARRGGGRS
jgi:AcrR family transcriptional regulator